MRTFRELMGFGFMPQIVFDTGGDSSSSSSDSSSNDSSSSTTTTTPEIPVYDNYYDAIDAEGVGATVNIGGNIVSAETADGYTGSGSTASDSYVDDTFGTGNIYTESSPGASTTNYGNTVSYDDDDDDYIPPAPTPLAYTDTSSIAGISAASGVDYNPTANDDDNNYSYVDTSTPAGIAAASGDDYVFNPDDNTVEYDPIVSGGTGTSTAGTGGYGGSTYDEVPDIGGSTELDTTVSDYENEAYGGSIEDYYNPPPEDDVSDYENEAYGGAIEDFYNPPPSDDGGTSYPDTPPPSVAPPEPPAPPPVYYDAVGNPYGSQAEAAAADAAAEAAAAQAAANMAAAFDEPTAAEIAAANAAAQREAYDDDEFAVMSQPVAPAVNDPTGSEISYADILSGAGVSDEEIDSMRENILTGETDTGLEPLDFSFLDETNELLGELGVAPIDVDALTKVGDTGINLEGANTAPAAITEMALGGDDAPITYDGDQAAGASGQIDDGRYDFVDDLPDDALDFVTTEKTDADRVNDLVAAGVDRSLAEAQIASGGEIGEPAGIDAYDFGFDGGLTGQPVEVGATDDDLATDFSAVPTGVGATDDDLATDFSTVSVPTASEISPEDFRASEAALAGIDFETGLPIGGTVDETGMAILQDSTLQAVKDRVSEVEGTDDAGGYDRLLGGQEDNFGIKPSEMTVAEILDFQNKRGEGSYAAYSQDAVGRIATPVGKYQVVGTTLQGLVDSGVVNLDDKFDVETQEKIGSHLIESRGLFDENMTQEEFERNLGLEFEGIAKSGYRETDIPTIEEINQTASEVTGQTGSELYLSAMTKVSDPNYDPNDPNSTVKLSDEEQYALYGARGRAPNAAETAYLNDLLSDARHKEDVINPDTGEVIAKAGDYVTDQSFMDQAGDVVVNLIDTFLNPFSILGDQFTISGNNKARVEKQLEAYKNGGTFIYAEDGKTVVGVAEPNYDASGDGQNDTVVFNDDGTTTVVSRLSETDVNIVNNDDNDDNDISVVDSTKQYENTEDGVVVTTPTVEVGNDDDNIPICEEGFEFDPVEGICMPIDEIGDGTRKIKFKPRPPRDNTPAPTPTPTPTPDVGGLIIRQPQFNRGGVVTRNIDKFANGGVVTPNIDNFLGGMRR